MCEIIARQDRHTYVSQSWGKASKSGCITGHLLSGAVPTQRSRAGIAQKDRPGTSTAITPDPHGKSGSGRGSVAGVSRVTLAPDTGPGYPPNSGVNCGGLAHKRVTPADELPGLRPEPSLTGTQPPPPSARPPLQPPAGVAGSSTAAGTPPCSVRQVSVPEQVRP